MVSYAWKIHCWPLLIDGDEGKSVRYFLALHKTRSFFGRHNCPTK